MSFSRIVIVCLALLPAALAFPTFWKACDMHPSTGLKLHKAPEEDEKLGVAVKLDGEDVTSWCPGKNYTLEFDYGEPRRAMLTTTEGTFVQDGDDEGLECEMKRKTIMTIAPMHTVTWTSTTDADEVTVKITSSCSAACIYWQKELTLEKGEDCDEAMEKMEDKDDDKMTKNRKMKKETNEKKKKTEEGKKSGDDYD